MSASRLPADGDESPYRWSSFTLRRTIFFSLALHALLGGALVLTAADQPAASQANGTTVVSLRHEIAASSAPATRTTASGARAATSAATPAVVATTAPIAMRVTPVRAIDNIAAGNIVTAHAPTDTPVAVPTATTIITAAPTSAAAPAGTPADTTAIDDARRRYLAALGPLLRKHLVYPPTAQRRGLEGQVTLSLRIARDGSVQALAVRRSSGEPLLDDGALATVRRAAPLPPLPAGLPEAALDVNVPLSFGLDTRSAPQ